MSSDCLLCYQYSCVGEYPSLKSSNASPFLLLLSGESYAVWPLCPWRHVRVCVCSLDLLNSPNPLLRGSIAYDSVSHTAPHCITVSVPPSVVLIRGCRLGR